jgi:broad specificity phosphatase PhoE
MVIDDRLVELDYGEWDERPVAEITPAEWAAWRADPAFAPPGGESLLQLGARVREAFEDLAALDGTTLVVTHVSPIKAAVAWALGVGDEATWRMFVAQASLSRIEAAGGGPRLVSFNDVGHLESL